MSKKIFLLDAYALIYRSYYAFIRNPRYNSKNQNTSAIYGFTNTLVDVLHKENPSHIAVVFDPGGPTFRHEMYKEYKAHREEMPEDIRKSIPYIKKIIDGFNIPIIQVEKYEADDVIATLARKIADKDHTAYMMTPDKDYAQVVGDKIVMYKPGRGGKEAEVLDADKIRERYKIEDPEQIIDILALMGDSSDNIPGAPGIGEKTAQKLIAKYGSIENLYENIEDLKGKQKEKLIENKEQVMLSKELVTIDLNAPVDFDLDKLEVEDPNEKELTALFEELEFKTLGRRLFQKEIQSGSSGGPLQGSLFGDDTKQSESNETNNLDNTPHEYILVKTEKELKKLLEELESQKEFCFDTETGSLDIQEPDLVGISFSWEPGKAYYVSIDKGGEKRDEFLKLLQPVLENASIKKIGQNIKYDILVLRALGIMVRGELFDTMVAHYLIQPELRHNMDALAEQYLNYHPQSITELIGDKGKNQGSMRDVPLDKAKEYAAEDADITYQLKILLEKELKENNLLDLAEEIEFPLIYVLAEMEHQGVKIDTDALNNYSKKLEKELQEVQEKIFEMSGEEFNISSPKQLGVVLFEKMNIDDKAKKTKSKQYSTSEETLSKLADKHPIIHEILEFRSLKKLLSTYVNALPKLIHSKTGRIHASFNQTIAATGRLSSTNPNLQNIPIREERGKEIRRAFVPEKDKWVLLAADYSQIELRLMAHMSQDKHMLQAFKNNEDIHRTTAAKIFHVENPEEVTDDQRRKAKTANFGIIYGISAFGLSQRLSIPRTEAKEIIDEYFKNFDTVKSYMDRSIQFGRDNGYVETMMGRKRFLPDINSRNATVRGFAERNAINAPIQGSAADIIKIAMIDVLREIRKENWKSRMILQVHDELIFEVPEKELESMKKMVKNKMEQAVMLSIPLTVDLGTGKNWLEAH